MVTEALRPSISTPVENSSTTVRDVVKSVVRVSGRGTLTTVRMIGNIIGRMIDTANEHNQVHHS